MIDLWTFACKMYKQPEIKKVCLLLQDEYDVNVCIVLFLCWMRDGKRTLSCGFFFACLEKVAQINTRLSKPVRMARRASKTIEESCHHKGIYAQALALELEYEKLQLNILQSLSQSERFLEKPTITLLDYLQMKNVPPLRKFISVLERAEFDEG